MLQRGSGQAALEKPGSNSSSPVEARQESSAVAGGPQGLWPEWEGVAVRGPWPAPQPHPSSCLLWVTCGWGRHTKASGACGSYCMAAFYSFSSGGEVLPETQHPVFQGVLEKQGGTGWGEVGGAERWVLWGLLGSSPARVGSRLASEG